MKSFLLILLISISLNAGIKKDALLVLSLTSIQAYAEYCDGYSTLYGNNVKYKYCTTIKREVGLAKMFIGEHPTWNRMLVWGSVEYTLSTAISYKMKTSNIKILNYVWWVPPVALSAVHFYMYNKNMVEYNSHFK